MNSPKKRRFRWSDKTDTMALLLIGTSALAPAAGLAQERAEPVHDAAANEQLQEVVVTGTLIRNAAPVGSTVITVDQTQLAQSGANTVTDMLHLLPQIANTGVTESSQSGTGGSGNIVNGNSINLRGLSPFATLTLLNGHRVPASGSVGATVDPDSFPSLMMQKIDVVADGASATYGSDAIAGVVNLILRRDVEGAEVHARYGDGLSYEENQLGILLGHNWGSGQLSVGLEQMYHSNLNGENRSFFESNQTGRGGANYSSSQCSPGNIEVGNNIYAIPAGGVTPASAGSLVAGTSNTCDPAKSQDLLPEVRHQNIAFTFDQKVTDSLSIFADGTYARRTYLQKVTPAQGPVQVPASNAYFVAPPGTGATTETVDYSFVNEVGPNGYNYGASTNLQGTLGFKLKLAHDWQVILDGSEGYDHDLATYNQQIDGGYLGAALASSNPATALNVFGGKTSSSVIDQVFGGIFAAPGVTGLQVLEAKADGPLFELPGGELRLAVGAQWEHDELTYGENFGPANDPADQFSVRTVLNRHSTSEFVELLVPVFGAGNALPGLRKLELDVAGRHELYSDVGGTSHPKIGVNWSPLEAVLVHASYGTSFRAPHLSELVGPSQSVYVQTYSDPLSPTKTSLGYTLAANNPNLKPETATTYSFGADYTPAPNAKLSLTFYDIDYKNQINSYLADLTILQQANELGSLVTRCPSAACTALIDQYVTGPNALPIINGSVLANPSVFVNGDNLNLGTTKTDGLDFQGGYSFQTPLPGAWNVGLAANFVFRYSVQFAPGGDSFEKVGRIGYPARYRLRGNIGWDNGPWSTMLFLNFTPSYVNDEVTPTQTVSSHTTADIDVAYNFGEPVKAYWAKGLVARLHVMNLGNTTPPYVDIPISSVGGGGFDPQAASPIGRLISLELQKKF